VPIKELGAVILAGGQASRLGYVDKPLLRINDKAIIRYVIDKASQDATKIIISVNRHKDKFRHLDLPLIDDKPYRPNGPLVGIYSAMAWFKLHAPEINHLACFPADVPFFPEHTARTLLNSLMTESTDIAWCSSRGQIQPLFSVWSLAMFDQLETAIGQGVYGPKFFIPQQANSLVCLDALTPRDFVNINTQADLERVQSMTSAVISQT